MRADALDADLPPGRWPTFNSLFRELLAPVLLHGTENLLWQGCRKAAAGWDLMPCGKRKWKLHVQIGQGRHQYLCLHIDG